MADAPLCHIVGIGASAGGLEALEELFSDADPAEPIAYVVIQHLSPDFKSLMDELLARRTRLAVHVIEDTMVVQPGTIYLLPPKKEAILSGGRLLLTDRARTEPVTFPIDHFLRSLAQDSGSRAVGVILSGTGTDGTRGILDIHGAGGLAITQRDAKFDGMTSSANNTGVVGLNLDANQIIPAIVRRVSQTEFAKDVENSQTVDLDPATVRILDRIHEEYGIDFNNYRVPTISRRIIRRLTLSKIETLESYASLVETDVGELDRLYRDLLIGVTSFFRDPDVFSVLADSIIPKLVDEAKHVGELRIWVAACATGEEAYSVAILVAEHLESIKSNLEFRIFASDVHEQSLEFAGHGLYDQHHVKGVSSERLNRFFVRQGDQYRISRSVRSRVVFTPHNVLTDAPFTRLDLVTCRNMLIYLVPQAQRKALSLFHFGLRQNGYLLLGGSESIGELEDEYLSIDAKSRIYMKHRELKLRLDVATTASRTVRREELKPVPAPGLNAVGSGRMLMKTYDRLLDQFVPPSILIDCNRQIVHTFPGASRFLRFSAGRPTTDALLLLNPSLKSVIAPALRQLDGGSPAVSCADVIADIDGTSVSLDVSVWRFESEDPESHILIQFSNEKPADAVTAEALERSNEGNSIELELIERELEETKANLQSTIEELQSTNEELQSTNEELTASNEELQSTNEELHSVNEELYTVNTEHQRKISELVELTNDMDNLLNSIDVHTLFLDLDLNIRRFTPGVATIFNLIPQDVGRRFNDFSNRLRYDKLDDQIQSVIENGRPTEAEVSDDKGVWHFLRIRPYVAPNGIDGVILTMVEITSLKVAQARLLELSEIVEHSDDAIIRVGLDGRIRTWNNGAVKLFGYEASEILGNNESMLAPDEHMVNAADYLTRIQQVRVVDRIETVRRRKDGSTVHVALTISPIRNHNDEIDGASIIARDITKQKIASEKIRQAVLQRDQFLGTLSHELRNPFAAILNANSLLRSEKIDADTEEEARDVIENQLRHISHLLDDLLEVSRFTNGKLILQSEPLDLNDLVNDVIDCVQHKIAAANQSLQVNCVDHPVFVDGDRSRLQQAQVNLLVNACKYSGSHSTIWYSVSIDDGNAVISVRDEGQGISAELQPKIFEPFVQADQTIDRTQGGMGLGLPLVRAIAMAHGGTAEAHSAGPGCGSEFIVRLPLTDKRPKAKIKSGEADPGRWSILLVEDNDGIRRMLARTLQLRGFHVDSAATGQKGLAILRDSPPQVAIVDIGLPDVDGYEFARRVRMDPQHNEVVLIAVTGYGRADDRKKALDSGFNLHLVKPVDPDELVSQISRCMQSHNDELSVREISTKREV
ncbi:MAG: CheR family methyltransferase [Planctomycetota bacterium]